jgi:phage replication-related protein YjqB (UPF0714/DUF867 family)
MPGWAQDEHGDDVGPLEAGKSDVARKLADALAAYRTNTVRSHPDEKVLARGPDSR